ncbi:unnamed protein product [Vitrella brassicaformis CCMP3155]|uniref:Uncharacterized protein n=2 Tax=Vitrella brassicaformis TaxID=1169539 RepID=A0A0G4E901_VITBC|nr:unnamed protein product [Vitrella brassicaformis CCMP3155]|eukprot:CEL91998.1 unnamed protein product [Vitrella brassicaformis CCMP3155]
MPKSLFRLRSNGCELISQPGEARGGKMETSSNGTMSYCDQLSAVVARYLEQSGQTHPCLDAPIAVRRQWEAETAKRILHANKQRALLLREVCHLKGHPLPPSSAGNMVAWESEDNPEHAAMVAEAKREAARLVGVEQGAAEGEGEGGGEADMDTVVEPEKEAHHPIEEAAPAAAEVVGEEMTELGIKQTREEPIHEAAKDTTESQEDVATRTNLVHFLDDWGTGNGWDVITKLLSKEEAADPDWKFHLPIVRLQALIQQLSEEPTPSVAQPPTTPSTSRTHHPSPTPTPATHGQQPNPPAAGAGGGVPASVHIQVRDRKGTLGYSRSPEVMEKLMPPSVIKEIQKHDVYVDDWETRLSLKADPDSVPFLEELYESRRSVGLATTLNYALKEWMIVYGFYMTQQEELFGDKKRIGIKVQQDKYCRPSHRSGHTPTIPQNLFRTYVYSHRFGQEVLYSTSWPQDLFFRLLKMVDASLSFASKHTSEWISTHMKLYTIFQHMTFSEPILKSQLLTSWFQYLIANSRIRYSLSELQDRPEDYFFGDGGAPSPSNRPPPHKASAMGDTHPHQHTHTADTTPREAHRDKKPSFSPTAAAGAAAGRDAGKDKEKADVTPRSKEPSPRAAAAAAAAQGAAPQTEKKPPEDAAGKRKDKPAAAAAAAAAAAGSWAQLVSGAGAGAGAGESPAAKRGADDKSEEKAPAATATATATAQPETATKQQQPHPQQQEDKKADTKKKDKEPPAAVTPSLSVAAEQSPTAGPPTGVIDFEVTDWNTMLLNGPLPGAVDLESRDYRRPNEYTHSLNYVLSSALKFWRICEYHMVSRAVKVDDAAQQGIWTALDTTPMRRAPHPKQDRCLTVWTLTAMWGNSKQSMAVVTPWSRPVMESLVTLINESLKEMDAKYKSSREPLRDGGPEKGDLARAFFKPVVTKSSLMTSWLRFVLSTGYGDGRYLELESIPVRLEQRDKATIADYRTYRAFDEWRKHVGPTGQARDDFVGKRQR